MKKYIVYLIIALSAYWIGHTYGIGNQYPKYAKSGFPVNCRALIADNLAGYYSGAYTAKEALYSIERNCGSSGLVWNER